MKLFRVKESVYFQKLVKYSTRSELHQLSSTDYSGHAQIKMKVGQNQVNRKGVLIIVKGFLSRCNLSETRRGVKFGLTHIPSLANTNLNVVLKF